MKRFLTILFTTLLLTAALCITASASSFDDAAEELSAIGIFKGSASGFQLDQAPTRSQAAIMLVRLYGAEDEAKAAYASGETTHPFTDVSDTAAPYVAWLVKNGLANGTTPTTFGASNPCTSKAYTIFLLRALGYKDDADFTTGNAQDFAMGLGLLDTSLFSGQFLRDDLAALTYQALASDLKDGSTYLLDSLIQSGAIDAEAAKPITDKIEAYRSLQTSTMEAMNGCLDTGLDIKANVSYSIESKGAEQPININESMEMTGSGSAQVILEEDDMQMAMDLSLKMEDETMDMAIWIKDGILYVRSGEEAYKEEIPGMAELSQAAVMPDKANAAMLLPFLKSVSSKTSGTDTVYSFSLNDAFASIISNLAADILNTAPGMGDLDMRISMDGSTFTYTVAESGQLKNVAVTLNMDTGIDMQDSQATVKVSMKMEMDMNVKATGQNVEITFPDFSGFKDTASVAA